MIFTLLSGVKISFLEFEGQTGQQSNRASQSAEHQLVALAMTISAALFQQCLMTKKNEHDSTMMFCQEMQGLKSVME